MKYVKYIILIIVILGIGYIIVGLAQKKGFDNEQQSNREQYVLGIFDKFSSEYNLKFSSYQEAKRYFEKEAGVINIKNMSVFSRRTSYKDTQDTPILRGRISEDLKNNRCKSADLNLITGEFLTNEDVCIIFN